MLALEYYSKNLELFKQDEVQSEKVLKVMIERGYTPSKPIKMKKIKTC